MLPESLISRLKSRMVRSKGMHGKITDNALPTVAAIQAEAARIESMILAAVQREESSHLSPAEFMQLQMCRSELQAYLAGLLFSLGHTNLLRARHNVPELAFQETELGRTGSTPIASSEEEEFQCVE
jgi:hypothetical protein